MEQSRAEGRFLARTALLFQRSGKRRLFVLYLYLQLPFDVETVHDRLQYVGTDGAFLPSGRSANLFSLLDG